MLRPRLLLHRPGLQRLDPRVARVALALALAILLPRHAGAAVVDGADVAGHGARARAAADGPASVQADAGAGSRAAPVARGTEPSHRFAEPLPGLHAGGQPGARDLARLQAQGVRTVIDLRGPGEDRGFDEPAEARRLGLEYIALPIAGRDDVTAANAAALQALLDARGDGVLLHCASGNRAGALLALGAAGGGMPREQALDLGRRAGMTSLEARVVELLDAAPPPAH